MVKLKLALKKREKKSFFALAYITAIKVYLLISSLLQSQIAKSIRNNISLVLSTSFYSNDYSKVKQKKNLHQTETNCYQN